MRKRYRYAIGMTMGMLFLAFPRIADATKAKYDILKAGLGTGGDAVDCTACHVGWRDAKESRRRQVRRSLNAFGKDYKDWSRLRRGKVEDLLAKDSDGDGVSNGDELRGGSNPSDRQSVPKTASADGCGLDPNCRLAKMIQEEGRSFDSDRQRRAAYAQFLLALLSGDEKTLANVVAAGGYCEGDESKGLCAADLLKRWKELNVAWPKDQSLDALIDCQASKFATPVTFKRLIPGIQRKPEATQYPVYAPLCGQCTILKGPPVVILEKQARRWRVIGGNVLSCWAKPPTATQPAAAPAAAKPAEAPPATPAAPKRTVTVNVRPVGKSK